MIHVIEDSNQSNLVDQTNHVLLEFDGSDKEIEVNFMFFYSARGREA